MPSSPPPSPLACLILAAGQGTRMKSDTPKVLHTLAGLPMIGHVLSACAGLAPERMTVVIGPNMAAVEQAVLPYRCVVQQKPLGTGDAVRAARNELKDFRGDILVVFGDAPLITTATLRRLQQKQKESGAAIVISAFVPEDPSPYGRLLVDSRGSINGIVEALDATLEQRSLKLCNGGVMLFAAGKLWPLIDQLRDDNAKKEFYLTDCVKLAAAVGDTCVAAEMPADEVLGINTRIELAIAENLMQNRLRSKACSKARR